MKLTEEQTNIVRKIADYIMALPLGTNMTTWQVMADVFPELRDESHRRDSRFMGLYFFEWHFAICDAVEHRGRTLDFSAHDDMVQGLPYNLDFVLQ